MQNIRKSLQNTASSGGLSPARTPASLAPPRKVIKALYDYRSQQSEELSFTKGEFFYVVGNEDDEDWFEASNPVTGERGFVPVTYFQVLEKNHRNSNQSLDDTANDSGSYTEPSPTQQSQIQFHSQNQAQNHQRQHSANSNNQPGSPGLPQKPQAKFQPLYGIVLYDFSAERADELDAKVGDAILVIAQSNEEWYVAKPIGRLGGPGLIPVNFIEIRNMATGKAINVQEHLRQTGTSIPRVEEWKKQTLEYKAKSIPLGRIDSNETLHQQHQQQQQQQQQPHSQHQQQHHPHQQHHHSQQQQQQQQQHHLSSQQLPIHPQLLQQQQQNTGPTIQQLKNKMSRDLKAHGARDPALRRNPSQDIDANRSMMAREDVSAGRMSNRSNSDAGHNRDLDPTSVVNATVEGYHSEDDQYWFTVRVELANGATRNLYRLYDDFYDFHIALLEEFPVEGGRVSEQQRILPFMPIPLQVVNDAVTATRRADLDAYVQDLCKLPRRITQHPLVENLFALRDGDQETLPNLRSSSPSVGRTTPSNSMLHSAMPGSPGDRRPSHSSGPRAAFAPRSQGGPASYRGYGGDDTSSSVGASPSLRSQSSFPSPAINGSGSNEEMIKLKISFQDDIMAMRIPVSITFKALQQKILERLQVDQSDFSYRDERGNFAKIQTDEDVRDAIDKSGGKLMIYVD
ncbi:bud emergence protein 1 [Podila epigama]|nr:bud emergence protein 1 [Podila epigama]